MSGVWRSLFWKEWREQRWLFLSLLVMATLVAPAPFIREESPPWLKFFGWFLLLIPATSFFLGSSIAASEQAHRTIGFLRALPARSRRAAVCKLLVALMTIWAPCIAFWLVILCFSKEHPIDAIVPTACYALAISSALIWMAALGVNRSDEVRAGAIGLLGILLVWAILAIAAYTSTIEGSWLFRLATVIAPFGLMTLITGPEARTEIRELAPAALLCFSVVHLALIGWYVGRFGRVSPARRQPIERLPHIVKAGWLGPPRRWPLTAMLWKQARETLPLAGLGAAAVLIISISLWLAVGRYGERTHGTEIIRITAAVWITTGVLVSIVAGIGLFIDDVRPGLHDFWRSRPIPTDQWLAAKFVPGLLLTLVTLFVPAAVVSTVAWMLAPVETLPRGELVAGAQKLLAALSGQAAAYCVAAALMAVLRRPVFSALMTIVLGVCMMIVMETSGVTPGDEAVRMVEVFSVLAIVGVASAWTAVRKDWGWKG